jgi:rubrerythrin
MVTPAYYEMYMNQHKKDGDKKNAIKDTVAVLKQYGYTAGAEILTDMANESAEWKKISSAKIYECSKCGQIVMTDEIDCYKFCHGCGKPATYFERARV